jgi:hypothetical protein
MQSAQIAHGTVYLWLRLWSSGSWQFSVLSADIDVSEEHSVGRGIGWVIYAGCKEDGHSDHREGEGRRSAIRANKNGEQQNRLFTLHYSNLKTEAGCLSETLVSTYTVLDPRSPHNVKNHGRENLKTYIVILGYFLSVWDLWDLPVRIFAWSSGSLEGEKGAHIGEILRRNMWRLMDCHWRIL